jgi:thiol-disulfide isomerase/thioredoxin
MPGELLIRAVWALLIVGSLVGTYWLVNRVILARVRGRGLGLENLQPGIPAILYFTTPDCVPCKTVQRPALARLQAQMAAAVQVIEVDASSHPDLANYWGVLSVPTTFIIDSSGEPRSVNHGVASADKLQAQIEAVKSNRTILPLLKKILLKD